jgi:hypothetical protein
MMELPTSPRAVFISSRYLMISATIMYALEEVEVITTRIIHMNAAGARFSFFLRAAAPPQGGCAAFIDDVFVEAG